MSVCTDGAGAMLFLTEHIVYLNDKVQAFARKLVHWKKRVEIGRTDMFSDMEEFMEENALSVNSIKASVTVHLQCLSDHFRRYFPEGDAPEFDWMRSPSKSSGARSGCLYVFFK